MDDVRQIRIATANVSWGGTASFWSHPRELVAHLMGRPSHVGQPDPFFEQVTRHILDKADVAFFQEFPLARDHETDELIPDFRHFDHRGTPHNPLDIDLFEKYNFYCEPILHTGKYEQSNVPASLIGKNIEIGVVTAVAKALPSARIDTVKVELQRGDLAHSRAFPVVGVLDPATRVSFITINMYAHAPVLGMNVRAPANNIRDVLAYVQDHQGRWPNIPQSGPFKSLPSMVKGSHFPVIIGGDMNYPVSQVERIVEKILEVFYGRCCAGRCHMASSALWSKTSHS